MELEVGQLVQRYTGLRVMDPGRVCRLAASIAQDGQQAPVLVVGEVLVDGYHRVAALRKLGRDLVQAASLAMAEEEALLLAHRLETGRRKSVMEEGWLLQELMENHGRTQATLALELRRPKSWISQRLGMVRTLPEAAQVAIRKAVIPPQGAMKVLLPMCRRSLEHCERLIKGIGNIPVSVRQLERIYIAWQQAQGEEAQARVVDHPHLLLKVEEAVIGPITADEEGKLLSDLEALSGLCQRLRRQIRKGEFARANTGRLKKTWHATALAFEGLKEEIEHVGS